MRRLFYLPAILESFGDPQFDKRLPGHSETSRFVVEIVDDPCRKIDVDALGFDVEMPRRRPVEIFADVFAIIGHPVEFFYAYGLHNDASLIHGHGARK